MRTILKATIGFGRIAIPVGLCSTHVDGDVSLKTLHRECQTPIQMRVWCPACARVVENGEELVKGAEVAPGQFVLFEPEELAAAVPEDTRMIELVGFAPATEVDPVEFDRSYYLAPSKEAVMRKPYVLLATVLGEHGFVGLAHLTAWETEYIAALRPLAGGALCLHLMHPLEDRVDPHPIEEQLVDVELQEQEVDLATELVMRLLRAPTELGSSRKRERMRGLVEAKLTGREIVHPEKAGVEEAQLPIVELDLAGALKASLKETRKPRAAAKRKRKTAAKV